MVVGKELPLDFLKIPVLGEMIRDDCVTSTSWKELEMKREET